MHHTDEQRTQWRKAQEDVNVESAHWSSVKAIEKKRACIAPVKYTQFQRVDRPSALEATEPCCTVRGGGGGGLINHLLSGDCFSKHEKHCRCCFKAAAFATWGLESSVEPVMLSAGALHHMTCSTWYWMQHQQSKQSSWLQLFYVRCSIGATLNM